VGDTPGKIRLGFLDLSRSGIKADVSYTNRLAVAIFPLSHATAFHKFIHLASHYPLAAVTPSVSVVFPA
jgi:hypothetical protein